VFTYLRPGELRELRWADVELERGIISVTRAWDSREDRVKEPKTRHGVRDLPIESALKPLLTRMRKGAQPTDLVAPLLSRIP
jgi:integrase